MELSGRRYRRQHPRRRTRLRVAIALGATAILAASTAIQAHGIWFLN
jgi:hypothetical protein